MDGRVAVSVVIAAFNAEDTIGAQLDALQQQDHDEPIEVVVADNGSTDRTAAIVEGRTGGSPAIRLVDAAERRGPAHARNVGAGIARGDLLVFCDADDVAEEGWVTAMASVLRSHDAVGGHLETGTINDARTIRMRPSPTVGGLPVAFGRWPLPIGASCGIRRARFEDLGGFDEAFPTAGGEDSDLFIRLQLAGGTVGWAPDAVMHYRLRPSVGATWRQAQTYGAAHAVLRSRYVDDPLQEPSPTRRVRDLAWMAWCTVLAPVSIRHRGQLVWWSGHELGRARAVRAERAPSGGRCP